MENMKNMGLFNIDGVEVGEKTDHPTAAYTRMTGAFPWKGHDHRTLGDRRYLFSQATAYLSGRLPRGCAGRVPDPHRQRCAVQ